MLVIYDFQILSISLTKFVQQNRIYCRTFFAIRLTWCTNISNTYLYATCFAKSNLLCEDHSSCLFIFSLDQSLCIECTIHGEPIHFSIDSPPYKSVIYRLYQIQQFLSYLESI